MNPIKITVNNFLDFTKHSFNAFKIAIQDFPRLAGIIFYTAVYAVSKVMLKLRMQIYQFYSTVFVISNGKLSSSLSIVNLLGAVFAVGKHVVKSRVRLILSTTVYTTFKQKIAILSKITRKRTQVFFTSVIKRIRIIIPYKIWERRSNVIKDIRNMSIKDFILKEEIG